jgi:nicotinamide-nucleotide amidase
VAESCTGGLIGARLTEIPGSSAVFLGGMVTYSDESKTRDLGVDPSVLARDGAVSDATARAMVAGVANRFGTQAAIAVTGVAGPGGGTEDKPVGTVCFAALWDGSVESMKRHVPGSRYDLRRRAAQAAMDLLRRMLAG